MPSEGDDVLTLAGTGFAMQGCCVVGVACQYSGTLGKIANGQVGVNCHDFERPLVWPVALRFSLSGQLALDQNRRDKGKVPKEASFQVRPAIALALRNLANVWRGEHSAETAEARIRTRS